MVISALLLFGFVGLTVRSAEAANVVGITATSTPITKIGCERLGSLNFEFDADTTLVAGDWWFVDLPATEVALCQPVDYMIVGQTNQTNAYAVDTTIGITAAVFSDPSLGIPSLQADASLGYLGPIRVLDEPELADGEGINVTKQVAFRVTGSMGSHRLLIEVVSNSTDGQISVGGSTAFNLRILDGTAYTDQILLDSDGDGIYGEDGPDDIPEDISPNPMLYLFADAEDLTANQVSINPSSKDNKFTFTGDYELAHVVSADYTGSMPAVAYDPDTDHFLTVYSKTDGGIAQIWCLVLDGAGNIVTAPTQLYHDASNFTPDVAYDSVNQVFLVVWEHYPGVGGLTEIYGMHAKVRSDGSIEAGTQFIVNCDQDTGTYPVPANQTNPAVAFDATNGDFVVVWEDDRGGDGDIYSQRVQGCDPIDGPLCAPRCSKTSDVELDNIVADSAGRQAFPDIAFDPSSGAGNEAFMVTWVDYPDGSARDIYVRVVDQYGAPILGALPLNITNNQSINAYNTDPSLAYDPDDDAFMVVWNNRIPLVTYSLYSTYAALAFYLPSPAPSVIATSRLQVAAQIDAPSGDPAAGYNSTDHSFLATWWDSGVSSPTGRDIYGRYLYFNGNNLSTSGDQFLVNGNADDQDSGVLVSLPGVSGFLSVFESGPSGAELIDWTNVTGLDGLDSDGDGILNQTDTDDDNDGLEDWIEATYSTNPYNPDSDGDGYNDGREVAKGSDPLNDASFSGIPDTEWSALVDVYNSTNGPEWSDSSGWLDDSVSECTWFGITCTDNHNHVVDINLSNNNLSGVLPSGLQDLSSLTGLWMHDNNLSGTIPQVWGSLSDLMYFDVAGNQLSGSIPAELGDLSNLEGLWLNGNRLSGSIPTTLGNLSNLTSLILSGNQLSGPIPAEIGNLSALEILFLFENQLVGPIPLNLMNLTALIDGQSDFRWNYLYTPDDSLRDFLNLKQIGGDWESYQYNLITGYVLNVYEPGAIEKTYIEIIINEAFTGSLPGDVTNITVEGPSGVVASYPSADWKYYPQWRDFFISLDGPPEIGTYTFTVTFAGTYPTATDTDFQYVIRSIPNPDESTFSPAEGATLTSKTPSFSWQPVASAENFPIYYRLEINDGSGNRVYASNHVFGMTSHTVPLGILQAGQSYRWRVRAVDASDGNLMQNRSHSEWQHFTMADTLSHSAPPAIDLDGWGALSWTWDVGQTGTEIWVRVYDLDGISSDGSSHKVTVQLQDDPTKYPMDFVRSYGPNSAGYEFWHDSPPPAGTYILTVTDPDGYTATITETLDAADINPLDPPDPNTITPNLLSEHITASFDNVYVNGNPTVFEDFDGYNSINDIDWSKWEWYQNATIQQDGGNGRLVLDIGNSVGRTSGQLSFADKSSINAIKADITITNTTTETPRAEIGGTWCHNGVGDVGGRIRVTSNQVYYSVWQEYFNDQDTYHWDTPLSSGTLLTGDFESVPVTVEIIWDEPSSTLTFSAENGSDSNTATYVVTGNVGPPIIQYKDLRARINLVTDTTPTFTWAPVAFTNSDPQNPTYANRYRLRIYNGGVDNRREIWRGTFGEQTDYTVPPGVLKPGSYYRYRIEAWDSPSPLNVNNISKTPADNNDYFIFYTDDQEAVDPFIELDNSGVRTWNDPVNGAFLHFRIKVHDAQGVPDDISSVTVEHPSGAVTTLDPSCSDSFSPSTPTSCIYSKSSFKPIEGGDYIFRVIDTEGHIDTVTETLTPGILDLPELLSPAGGATIGDTAVNFDWSDVPDAKFYSIVIYDWDYNLVYTFHTEQSDFSLAAGFLKSQTLYRWRVKARREYFSENSDNNSASSDFWTMSTFATTPSSVDSDGDQIPDYWEELHGLDPALDDAGLDRDNDGLTNIEEFENGTDPEKKDSDGDGLSDYSMSLN